MFPWVKRMVNEHFNPNTSRRVALVTGGAGLIGASVCELLAREDFSVIMVDSDPARIKSAQLSYSSRVKDSCKALVGDVSTSSGAHALVFEALQSCGHIDVLINNAATKTSSVNAFYTPDIDYEAATWREVMATNLDGAFYMCQAVGRQMLLRGQGSIVNVASIYGVVGADQRIYEGTQHPEKQLSTPAVYAASKAGLLGLTRHFAAAWGPKGLRVNAVTPGGVENGQDPTFIHNYSGKVPLGRMATVTEIAATICFLASNGASYINGHNLVVDGGLTTW